MEVISHIRNMFEAGTLRDDERDIAPNSAAASPVWLHFATLENAYFRPRAEFCTLSFFSDYWRGKRVYLYVIKVFKRTKARRPASFGHFERK